MRFQCKKKRSEESESTERDFQSNQTRPKPNLRGGYGEYCCIPGCKSAAEDINRKRTKISLFKIRKEWISTITKYRRKGGKDGFNINGKNVRICEFHFNS